MLNCLYIARYAGVVVKVDLASSRHWVQSLPRT